MIIKILKFSILFILFLNITYSFADFPNAQSKEKESVASQSSSSVLVPTLVINIEFLGGITIEGSKEKDAVLLKKFSKIFRDQLKQQTVFEVIDNEESIAQMMTIAQIKSLHNCKGCELELANKMGAKQVVVPWIVRMSERVQTLMLEIRDVETESVIFKKPYVFRGSSEKAWMQTIMFAVYDLKREMKEN